MSYGFSNIFSFLIFSIYIYKVLNIFSYSFVSIQIEFLSVNNSNNRYLYMGENLDWGSPI